MRLYVDSNVVIKAFEGGGAVRDFCAALFRGKAQVVTSELTLAEVLVGPLKKRGEKLRSGFALTYEAFVVTGPFLTVVTIDRDTLIASAEQRARHASMKLPDAIHAATATLSGCTHFISGDRRLFRALSPQLTPVDIENPRDRAVLHEALS